MSRLKKPKTFSVKKARSLQHTLSKRVIAENRMPATPRYVAGVDVAYRGGYAIAAIAVLDWNTLKVVETKTARMKSRFPYIPTLLSFREAPVIFRAINKLRLRPSIYLIDGHGWAHPYRCGLATHVGVVAQIPTIGVAKSLLCGEVKKSRGEWSPIVDGDETIGAAVFAIKGRKPIYVSIGHMVSLNRAVDTVLHCTGKSRIPEPIRAAHSAANEAFKSC